MYRQLSSAHLFWNFTNEFKMLLTNCQRTQGLDMRLLQLWRERVWQLDILNTDFHNRRVV